MSRRLTHGLSARHRVTTAVVNLRGFNLDRRSKPFLLATEVMNALGGAEHLSPQKRRLVELLTRANLLLDAADAWLFEQQSIISADGHSLLPVIKERQAIAEHVARLLDKLGLERVAKPIDLASYYADAKPVEAQPDEPVVSEVVRQPVRRTHASPAKPVDLIDFDPSVGKEPA